MRRATVDEVKRAIDRVAEREPGGAIAFDGDGTLWSGDVGEDYFAALLERGLHDASYEALAREARAENVDSGGTAGDVARKIYDAYRAGRFPEERVCEIMTWAAAGWSKRAIDEFCEEVIVALDIGARLHGEAMRIVEHASGAGIEVHLVSASPRAIVAQAARVVGIDPANVTAACESCDDAGIVLPAVERPIPYGQGKVTRLRDKLGPERVVYAAFGDNVFDVSMLREARVPVAIRPKARLLERALEVTGLVVLETV